MKNSKIKILLTLAVVALLFAFTTPAKAQKAEFGFRYMPTFSSFDMQASDGNTIKGEVTVSHGLGVLLGYNFNEYVGIQGEVIYSSVARRYSEPPFEHKVVLKYVNIPLLLSLNTGKTNMVNLNIVAGPQIGIRVGSHLYTSGDGVLLARPLLEVKKTDLGFAYGAGLDVGLNEERTFRLGLGFRGVYGLVNISDNSTTTSTDTYYILERTNIETYSGYIGFSVLF